MQSRAFLNSWLTQSIVFLGLCGPTPCERRVREPSAALRHGARSFSQAHTGAVGRTVRIERACQLRPPWAVIHQSSRRGVASVRRASCQGGARASLRPRSTGGSPWQHSQGACTGHEAAGQSECSASSSCASSRQGSPVRGEGGVEDLRNIRIFSMGFTRLSSGVESTGIYPMPIWLKPVPSSTALQTTVCLVYQFACDFASLALSW